MSESFWGTFIISVGVFIIALIFVMQRVTNSEEELYTLIKETTEAAMWDSFDSETYRTSINTDTPIVRINREAFVENFTRRFAQNASLANTYKIEIYDVSEYPPKVSLKVKTKQGGVLLNKQYDFNITNQIDAIIETTY